MSRRFLVVLFLICAVVVVLNHATLLDLPYFWDEAGQFVPASLDLYHSGALVPVSTLPNSHPPGVMLYLALVWRLVGVSIPATRIAMLFAAAVGLWALVPVTAKLCQPTRQTPIWLPSLLLFLTPLFYTQSLLAQLDLPAMSLTLVALWLFFEERWRACAFVCVALVWVKDTSLVVPGVFGCLLLWRDRSLRRAAWFLLPLAALIGWFAMLRQATGHWFGNDGYAGYNLWYPLHPVRLGVALLRRVYFVFVAEGRWVISVAVIRFWKQLDELRSPRWTVVWLLLAGHIVLFSFTGGATLERYLLPVLPLIYVAGKVAWQQWGRRRHVMANALTAVSLLASLFGSPPYPFPFENNWAMVDFIRLQQQVASYVAAWPKTVTVATAWPLTDGLRRPELGYVREPHRVVEMEDFSPGEFDKVTQRKPHMVVVYTRVWSPPESWVQWAPLEDLLTRFFDYHRPATSEAIAQRLGMHRVVRFTRRGQHADVYVR